MKKNRKFFVVVIFALAVVFSFIKSAGAYEVSIEKIKANVGEEFYFSLKSDIPTSMANGKIEFDQSKVEFVGEDENEDLHVSCNDGVVSWMYIGLDDSTVNEFKFKFKLKEEGETTLKLNNLEAIDANGNYYSEESIKGNKYIIVNDKSQTMAIIKVIGIIIVVAICSIMFIFIIFRGKNKK